MLRKPILLIVFLSISSTLGLLAADKSRAELKPLFQNVGDFEVSDSGLFRAVAASIIWSERVGSNRDQTAVYMAALDEVSRERNPVAASASSAERAGPSRSIPGSQGQVSFDSESVSDSQFKIALLAFNVANLADAVSTARALDEGKVREFNPLMPENTGAMLSIKLGTSIGGSWLLHKLHGKDPRSANITAWVLTSILAGAAINNMVQSR